MMSMGRNIDRFVGRMSRLLHLRAARHNTVADLERYLDQTPEALFPEPGPITDMRIEQGLVDRAMRARTLRWTSSHRILCPNYRRRHHREYRRNLTAWARWVRPDGEPRRSCMIYVHGWLEPGSWVEETTLFIRWTRQLGVDMLHISLPFHGRRTPRRALFSGEFFWTADLVRSIEAVRQAICDTRALMAWLRGQGYEQIGVSGISLGGALTMILACLEPVPDYIVPIVAHLALNEAVEEAGILWRMKHDLERWGVGRAQRQELFSRLGLGEYRPKLAPDRQLWIEARDDDFIDARLVQRQWEAWSQPNVFWIDGGHMTFPLHVNAFTQRMQRLLDELPSEGSGPGT